jgi:hypothetical protein
MRKRSKYRPRAVITNPLTLLQPGTAADKARVMLNFLTALDAMANGRHPGVDEWRSLSDAINTVETLALGMGKLVPSEVMPDINAAIEGMVHASRRFKAGQGARLDGPGLQALRRVVDIYGQCLDGFTAREMAMAQAETQRRVDALQRAKGNSPEIIEL